MTASLKSTPAHIDVDVPYLNTAEDRVVLSYEKRDYNALDVQRQKMRMRNGRLHGDLSLDREGFLLARAPSRVIAEQRQALIEENQLPSEVMGPLNLAYLAELAPLMLSLSGGAREVFGQYGTVQVRFSSRAKERSWLTTAQFAHLDFERTEIDRLLEQTLELTGRKVAPYSRLVMLQGWRVLTPPPQDNTLALCDGRSVSSSDIVTFDFHGPKGSRNELVRSRACRFNAEHEWYYFPELTPEELIVFKGFDSSIPESNNAMHTAFDDESVPIDRTVPRGSIESRFFVLYD